MKTAATICPDSAAQRVRSRRASEADEAMVGDHLAECADCRATWDVAQAFDALPALVPGDDALIARIARVATASADRTRWPSRTSVALAALVLLGAGAATGGIALYIERRASAPAETPPPAAPPPALRPRAESAPPASPPRLVRDHQRAEVAPRPARTARTRTSVSRAAPVAPASPPQRLASAPAPRLNATALFAEAGRARRAGQNARAAALYRNLVDHYPASPEAAVALVCLGRLAADGGDQAAALRSYDAYMRRAPGGPLAEEALWGRAGALRTLGRHAEERQALEALVARFPGSVYGPAARRRLGRAP